MAIFSFFNRPKPKQFNFKPRYYDADKERIKEIMERHEEINKSNPDAMKSRITQGFKNKGFVERKYESSIRRRSNRTLLLVFVVLLLLCFLLLSKYLPEIVNFLE